MSLTILAARMRAEDIFRIENLIVDLTTHLAWSYLLAAKAVYETLVWSNIISCCVSLVNFLGKSLTSFKPQFHSTLPVFEMRNDNVTFAFLFFRTVHLIRYTPEHIGTTHVWQANVHKTFEHFVLFALLPRSSVGIETYLISLWNGFFTLFICREN